MTGVSVIIPLYNKAPYILRALDSVAAQTFKDFEVIVVDDGSTDGGGGIVERYPDQRFRLVRQANAGPGAARNRGIREAQAPLVAFLDADDRWLPAYLETNVRILEEHPEAAAVGGGWIEYPSQIPCAKAWQPRGISEGVHRVSPGTSGKLLNSMATYMTPSMTILRAGELRLRGGFYEHQCRFAEDSMLWLNVLLHSPVYLHLTPLTEFHREASGLSRGDGGPRPIEPYLEHPEILRDLCPRELRHALDGAYTVRACRSACMLSYWGDWRRARELTNRFVSARDWRAPLFFQALAAGAPWTAWAARQVRKHRQRLVG